MSITRDLVQGFVDGFIKAGGDVKTVDVVVKDYAKNHHSYPVSDSVALVIASDLDSYVGVKEAKAVEANKDAAVTP